MSNTDPPNPWATAYTTTTNATSWNYITGYTITPQTGPQWFPFYPDKQINYAQYEEKNKPLPEGVTMASLYKVVLCYGEDRKKPIVHELPPVIASSDEDAKLKSGAFGLIQTGWDEDFLTIIVSELGDVKVKTRPQEVKQV